MIKTLLIPVLLLSACLAYAQADQTAIKSMFARQTLALNKQDLASYMSTIDPKSPAYAQTEKGMKSVFATFKLSFTADSLKIESVKGTSAQVLMVLSTRKISGGAFRNNRSTIEHTLIKRNGKWFTTDSKMTKVEYMK